MEKITLIKNLKASLIIFISTLSLYLLYRKLPFIQYLTQNNISQKTLTYKTSLAEEFKLNNTVLKNIPKENRLIIPKIGVNTQIIEGKDLKVIKDKQGVWHESETSTPEQSSNMVIAGHRWKYLPNNQHTFYLLPQLDIDEYIIVYWNQKEYIYQVVDKYKTTPNSPKTYIRTENSILTLYTCIPLETGHKRYVVKANLISKNG
jgi:LPXTG-site transpeptidase (sortase) family protein